MTIYMMAGNYAQYEHYRKQEFPELKPGRDIIYVEGIRSLQGRRYNNKADYVITRGTHEENRDYDLHFLDYLQAWLVGMPSAVRRDR